MGYFDEFERLSVNKSTEMLDSGAVMPVLVLFTISTRTTLDWLLFIASLSTTIAAVLL